MVLLTYRIKTIWQAESVCLIHFSPLRRVFLLGSLNCDDLLRCYYRVRPSLASVHGSCFCDNDGIFILALNKNIFFEKSNKDLCSYRFPFCGRHEGVVDAHCCCRKLWATSCCHLWELLPELLFGVVYCCPSGA